MAKKNQSGTAQVGLEYLVTMGWALAASVVLVAVLSTTLTGLQVSPFETPNPQHKTNNTDLNAQEQEALAAKEQIDNANAGNPEGEQETDYITFEELAKKDDCLNADITWDGKVDASDLCLLSAHWGANNCTVENFYCNGADLQRDGSVSVGDLALMGGA